MGFVVGCGCGGNGFVGLVLVVDVVVMGFVGFGFGCIFKLSAIKNRIFDIRCILKWNIKINKVGF